LTIYKHIRSALFRIEPEKAHNLTLKALRLGARLLPEPRPDDYLLGSDVLGLHFSNPFGLAAGFDKNAEVPTAMHKLGFGFTEVGTLTPEAQLGNPTPRVFRLPEHEAVINRLGFNNRGQRDAYERLLEHRGKGIIGVNIGANKTATDRIADYVTGVARFKLLADYLTINISSPNTPGLRDLQAADALDELIGRVAEQQSPIPVFLKIAPDLADEEISDIVRVAREHKIQGLIISNTTLERTAVADHPHANESGGLSGRPLMDASTRLLSDIYKLAGEDLVLIGVGGIRSGADAYAKIRAGASLVQLYTALVFQGPFAIRQMKKDLVDLLRRDGFNSLQSAVGADSAST
jgi:dihydroorotate dehydrogenase